MEHPRLFDDLTPDVCRAHHGGDECSEEANESIHAEKSRIRQRVLDWLKGRGYIGGTSDEIEESTGMSHQTVSARLRELVILRLATKTDRRRKTRSGRNAWVIIAGVLE
jgi:DNA-binding transcriptional ArsR family regulator